MAEQSDQRDQENRRRRFGSGRDFEDVLSEVYRHTTCLSKDLERVQSYLEAVSRKRDNR